MSGGLNTNMTDRNRTLEVAEISEEMEVSAVGAFRKVNILTKASALSLTLQVGSDSI